MEGQVERLGHARGLLARGEFSATSRNRTFASPHLLQMDLDGLDPVGLERVDPLGALGPLVDEPSSRGCGSPSASKAAPALVTTELP